MKNMYNTLAKVEGARPGSLLKGCLPSLARSVLLLSAIAVALLCMPFRVFACAADSALPVKTYVCAYNTQHIESLRLFGAEPRLSLNQRRQKLNLCTAGGALFGAVAGASATLKMGGLSVAPGGAAVGALSGVLLCLPVCYQEFIKQPPTKEEALNKCNIQCADRYEWGLHPGDHCKEIEFNDAKPAGTK